VHAVSGRQRAVVALLPDRYWSMRFPDLLLARCRLTEHGTPTLLITATRWLAWEHKWSSAGIED
jgi:hypothetical protein